MSAFRKSLQDKHFLELSVADLEAALPDEPNGLIAPLGVGLQTRPGHECSLATAAPSDTSNCHPGSYPIADQR